MSNSVRPHGWQPTRLPHPWDTPGKNTREGLPCHPPGDLPNPGIKPRSQALQVDSLPAEPQGKPKNTRVGCCCCCCVTSVMSDSVQPHGWQPTRLPHPQDSPGENTGVGCRFLLQCMKVKSKSEAAQLCPTPSDPMDCSPPGSSIHGFSRQEYWSGVPLPSLTDSARNF